MLNTLAFVLVFIQLGNGFKFCDKFKENNYKISYGYRHIVNANDAFRHYIFIGHDFWRLKPNDAMDDKLKTVSIDVESSGHSDWFGGEYSKAICLLYLSYDNMDKRQEEYGISGLMKTGSKDIEWTVLDANLNVDGNHKPSAKSSNSTDAMTATMSWVMNYVYSRKNSTHLRHVYFWDGSKTLSRHFADYKNPDLPEGIDERRHYKLYDQILANRTVFPVIAVLGQRDLRQISDDSLIVLFQHKHEIKYCYADLSPDKMPEVCEDKNLKTLIDCDLNLPPTPTPTLSASPSTSTWIVLVILVIVVVVLVVVMYFVYKWFTKGKTDDNSGQQSNASAVSDAQRSECKQLGVRDVPNVCLSAYLLGRLLQHKDKQLIIDCPTGCVWTGKEIHDVCMSLADAFINRFDLNPGDTVGFWCPNSDVHAIAFLATISSGATYLPIDPNMSYDDVYRVIKLSSAKFLICLSDNTSEALKILHGLQSLERLFIIDGNTDPDIEDTKNCHFLMQYMRYKHRPEADSSTKPLPIPVPKTGDDMCVMHFIRQIRDETANQLTPILLTNSNLIHSCTQLQDSQILQLTGDDCIVGQHFSHYLGVVLFCHSLVSGSKIAFTNTQFNRQNTLQFIQKYNITSASIDLYEVLYMCRNDVEIKNNSSKLCYDFSSLTDIIHTGSPLPHSDSLTEEVFRKLCPKYFRSIYGKPETGIISCVWKSMSTFDTNKCIANYYTVGHPVPGVQIKITHPQTEKSRSAHKLGEICVKSQQTIEKSRNLSIVTRNAFTIDGFYKTGDAGYYDNEGLLYVESRVNELIYEDNNVINPFVVEAILLQHSAVKEAAVIGVPDGTYGQICCAFVELEANAAVSEQTLREMVSNKGKELRAGIKFIESMPKTLRNQVNRTALRVIYHNFHTYSLIEML
ncbi:unnamed protein product [Medioppia subpectinata]|uniref:Luciferase n=1 Tax=Medioppia subpectinata TaxID=1979941 RepID=A0A7R9KTW9_9ACAR|nr:unnamed protein product [Medioppia subpectinata]CAG2108588.1 unnamed protein product [Medioppia subpectinata]